MKKIKSLQSLCSSRGNLLLNLALVLTVIGLIAIIVLQVLDLRKYVGH